MRWHIAAVASLAIAAAAQELPNPVIGGDFFDISGTVLDSVSAKPVLGASVSLAPSDGRGGSRSATADGAGEFHFNRVPVGMYELRSMRRGYAEGVDAYRKVILVGGTQPSHFELKLDPEALLRGLVRNDDGEPLADSTVLVLRPSILNGHKRIQMRESLKTDAQGQFRFLGLGPGPCLVAALSLASEEQRKQGMGYPPTFYPNAPDASTAQALDLKPGQDQEVEIRLTLRHAYSIRGKVTGGRDATTFSLLPTEDALSVLEPAVDVQYDPKTAIYALTGVPAGSYVLQAAAGNNEATMVTGFRTVSVSGHDLVDVNLTLTRGPSLRGSVKVGDGASPRDAVTSVSLQSLLIGADSQVGAGGSFAIQGGLPPRKYRLVVRANPGWLVQSATQAGRDVLRGDVQVSEDGASQPVEISMVPGGSTIEATVTWPETGQRRAARVTVLELNHGEMRLVAETKVSPPNEPAVVSPALIGSLPAGQYVLYAWPEPVTVDYASLDALQPFDSFAQTVRVGENEQTRAALKVVQLR